MVVWYLQILMVCVLLVVWLCLALGLVFCRSCASGLLVVLWIFYGFCVF